MTKLVWNAIFKNESKILKRCVDSLLPHIDGAVLVDTGSTDNSVEFLEKLFADAGKPLELLTTPFINFEQARNAALEAARASPLEWDYLLLADADMELKVSAPDWINGHRGQAYDMRQTAGALSYYNRRLVHRSAACRFVGVTHEFLDVPTAGMLDGAEFIDHADGANRPDKLARDVALIEQALLTETRPGLVERYTFYLAQTYFDLGRFADAAARYRERVALGGFPEERWYAQYRLALCWLRRDDPANFIRHMLAAWQMRPARAEPLVELAKHYRERGDNHASLLFSTAAMALPYPKDDLLFVDDYACRHGAKDEFAICAYYEPTLRPRGALACDEVALSRTAPASSREQARTNQYWYLQPLKEHVPSFEPKRIEIEVADGYAATNPSVVYERGRTFILVRAVNYAITPEGHYVARTPNGTGAGPDAIRTRNYLVDINEKIVMELGLPQNWPQPLYQLVRGFEDSRLFAWKNNLWTSSCVRELTPEGWCEQVLAPLEGDYSVEIPEHRYAAGWRRILPKERRHEKNWMPWVRDGELTFVYRLDTIVNLEGEVIAHHDLDIDVGHISGGSQVIRVAPQLHLALVHEARTIPGRSNRYYQHRFAAFDRAGKLTQISPPFVFHDRQIEFCAGLAFFPAERQLMASYGVMDREAWIATMSLDEVLRFIEGGS
jgi:glycosyltransferase involved in cell wall biosynthesis